MPKSKKFIDKKNSVTFHLVYRSQQDPLIADENAPQRVLVPVSEKKDVQKSKQLEEQHKYGIYFDDDYDYLQHLKPKNEEREWSSGIKTQNNELNLQLPSSVFASHVEDDVGLLNKAAPHSGPRPDLDPDIVEAMDDTFDFQNPDNILEDNFIELANASDSDSCMSVNSDFDPEDEEDFFENEECLFKDEETKSRFTEYSITSSVLVRNKQLALLDEKFEKAFANYDDSEIGALDCDEIEGYVPSNSELLLKYAEEFKAENKNKSLQKNEFAQQELCEDSSTSTDEDFKYEEVKDKIKWDCESILSNTTNIYNRPKLIEEYHQPKIKINLRTGMPVDVLHGNNLTEKNLHRLNEENDNNSVNRQRQTKSVGGMSVISALSTLSIRPKDETVEERKNRKKQLKELRRERRKEKKVNKLAFLDESKRQKNLTFHLKKNVTGEKIT